MKQKLSLIHIVDDKGRLRIKNQQELEFVYVVRGLHSQNVFSYQQLTKQRPR